MNRFMKKIAGVALVTALMLVGQLLPATKAMAVMTVGGEGGGSVGGSGGTTTGTAGSGEDVFGTIDAPVGVAKYNAAAGENGIGLITFISTIIRIATIVAGVWVMFNFILAGWTYITSNGDSKANSDVVNKITYSVIGLVIIVASYTLAALVGLVLFGDAGYILNPSFTGVPGA